MIYTKFVQFGQYKVIFNRLFPETTQIFLVQTKPKFSSVHQIFVMSIKGLLKSKISLGN